MKRNLISMTMVLFLLGCGSATMQYNYTPTTNQTDFPALNTVTTVYIGDEMLIQGDTTVSHHLNLQETTDIGCYDVPPGQYPQAGTEGGKNYYSMDGGMGEPVFTGGWVGTCTPITGLYTDPTKPGELCGVLQDGTTSCSSSTFSREEVQDPQASDIQKTLYFSGRKGDEVLFMYTEKAGGLASHTHNVTYNIKNTPVIGYRGARIEVLDATNESITYKVLENFPERKY